MYNTAGNKVIVCATALVKLHNKKQQMCSVYKHKHRAAVALRVMRFTSRSYLVV